MGTSPMRRLTMLALTTAALGLTAAPLLADGHTEKALTDL